MTVHLPEATPSIRLSVARLGRDRLELRRRIEEYLLDKTHRLFEPLRTLGSDGNAESLHKMRVSSRRLRVGLRFFSSLFPAGELKQVQRQLRRITRRLGELREFDVDVQLLRKLRRRLPPVARFAGVALEHSLLVERARCLSELDQLMKALDISKFDLRVHALIETHRRVLDAKRLLKESSRQLDDLRRAVRKRHRQFLKRRTNAAFHKLRIATKQYRYALEASQAVFQMKVRSRVRALETLQDLTGGVHDVEVLLDTIQRRARDNKTLAKSARLMVEILQDDRSERFAAFERFVSTKPVWTKKIKLTLPDE
ncbi:MAG TPA: CHAD domain-containing protein [Verrucomicrobiae bacterium]|nr:CHAD domain-containing protein [Verrucomicrobiae bacterium]